MSRSLRSGYPIIEQDGNYLRSLHNFRRVPLSRLRSLANTLPAQRCIRRIANTILSMPWAIAPPEEDKEKKQAIVLAKKLGKALRRPNREFTHNTYGKWLKATVTEISTIGFAAIERQKGTESTQPFWLWVADGGAIHANPEWQPNLEKVVPKFFDYGAGTPQGIYSENMFLVQDYANAYEIIAPSTIEVAYNMIEAWLGISKFQFTTTSNAIREYMLILEEVQNQQDLELFREYWRVEVEGEGHVPILNGKVSVTKLGARNDEELYPRYCEYLLRMIALAFGMTPRDMNISEHDNRATAGVAADASFQDAAKPMAECLREHINGEVIDYYYPGFEFEYADIEPRNQDQEANTAKTLFDSKIISKNEARQRVGEERLEAGGEVFSDGVKVGEEPAPPPPPGAAPAPPGQAPPGSSQAPPPKKGGKGEPKKEKEKKKKAEEKQQVKASSANYYQLSLF